MLYKGGADRHYGTREAGVGLIIELAPDNEAGRL